MLYIFPPDATDFSGNGLSVLVPSSCLVNETLNGEWELTMQHPIDDTGKWSRLQVGCIIKAPVPAAMTPRVQTLVQTQSEGKDIYRIQTSGGRLNLWSGPSRQTTSIAKYKNGLEVQVLSTANPNFYEAIAPDGKRGYMGSEYLVFVRSESTPQMATSKVVEPRQLRDQPFRIYRIVPELTQVSVYARHISYDLMDNMVYQYSPTKGTAAGVVASELLRKCQSAHNFSMLTDLTEGVEEVTFENTNPLEALLGEGGLVEKAGGELARDWFDLYLVKRVGRDTDIQIRQGKNLLGITYDVDDANVITRILPTGETEEGKILYLDEKFIDSPNIGAYPYPRWMHLPVSEAKVGKELSVAQAKARLRKAAQDAYENGCDLPDITIDVDFIDVADTLEYQDYKPLGHLFLGDGVRVLVKSLGLEVTLRMTEYSYDCLLKRYAKVVLGTATETIAGSMISPRQLPVGGIKGIKLAMGAIGTGHLQFASIGSLQVKTAAIGAAHIQQAAIETAHIQDAAITNAKIGHAVIETANIADAAISRAKIALAAIGTAQIENASITRAKIAQAAIGSAQIENAVIGTAHIKDASITNAKVVSLDAGKIQTGTLDAGNVNVVNLNAANITTGKLKSSQIDAGVIKASHIASKTITADQIQAGIITAASGLIAAAAIETAHIKDAAITNAKIGSLSASKITTGTLDAALAQIVNIDAGSITVGKINGVQIANGTVDMQHLHQTGVVQVISKAQATADGKNKVFYRTVANKPTSADGLRVDDLWFDLSNGYRVHRWTGSQWAHTPLGPSALDLEIGGTNLLTGTSAEFRNVNVSQYTGTVQSNVMYSVHRLSANDLITFRLYLKAINKPLRSRISQYREDGTYDSVVGDIIPIGSEGFSTVTTRVGADKVKLACLIQNGDVANLTTVTTEQYKWAKLERGNKPSDWSPAPGDVDALISSVSSTANGKNTVYYLPGAPTGGVYSDGDLWFDTSKGYRLSVRRNNAWVASAYSGEAIAASAITADHIATGAITAGKIVAGAILSDKIAANAVTAAKIAANAVVADKINAGAITTAKIATGAINADKIAAGAVEAAAIKAGVIDATHIAANTITGNKLAVGTVSTTYIADGAISTAKVQANAITTEKINAGAVTANQIAANAVTAAKINAGAVTATQIATGAVTAAKVAANAIVAGNIQASAVTTEKVATGAITATQLATNAVTAVKVLAGAITAEKIATNAVTADKVNAGAITTDKLGANAVTAAKIAAGVITAAHISAPAQETLRLAAFNSIRVGVRNLLLNSFTNISSTAGQYAFKTLSLSERLKSNTTYTMTFCGNKNNSSGELRCYVYTSPWVLAHSYAITTASTIIQQFTFTTAANAADYPWHFSAYNFPSGSTGTVHLKWATLVEGNKAPITWFPAPEDPVSALKTSYIDIATDHINISSGGKVNISAGGELKLSGARVQIDASDANNSHINFGSVFNVGRDSAGTFGLSINSPNDNAIRINGQPIWHRGNILIQQSQPPQGKGTLWLRPNATKTVDYRYTIKSKSESRYTNGGTRTYTLTPATSDIMSASGTYTFTVKFTLCNYGDAKYTFGTITVTLSKAGGLLTLTQAGTTLNGWVQREFTLTGSTTSPLFTSSTAGISCAIQIAGTKAYSDFSFLSHIPGTVVECNIVGPGGTSGATPCEVYWCP